GGRANYAPLSSIAIAAGVAWSFWRSLPNPSPFWRTMDSPWTRRTTGAWDDGPARACTPRAEAAALQAARGPAQAESYAFGGGAGLVCHEYAMAASGSNLERPMPHTIASCGWHRQHAVSAPWRQRLCDSDACALPQHRRR